MPNTHAETGIRFSVINAHSLDPDVLNDLFYGPEAIDEAWADALNERRATLRMEADAAVEQGTMSEEDADDWIDRQLEHFGDHYEPGVTRISGTYDGVSYGISDLGGAHLVWIFEGPVGSVHSLCSPCVPGAGDLDSGFSMHQGGDYQHEAYVCPVDWLAKVEA